MVAVAPLIFIAIALLALLIYYAVEWLGKVIIQWTPDIHIPALGNLKDMVAFVVHTAVDLIRAILYPVVHPIVDFIEGTATWCARIIGGLVDLTHQAAFALHEVRAVILPNLVQRIRDFVFYHVAVVASALSARIHDLRQWAGDEISAARKWAAGLVATTAAALGTRIHELRDDVGNWLGDIRDWTRGLIATAVAQIGHELDAIRGWTAQRIAGVEADLAGAVAGVEADLAAGVRTAEHFATAAATAAEHAAVDAVNVAATTATAVADGLLIHEIPELVAGLATDFPDIRAALGEIDLSKVGDLAGALSLTSAISLAVTRYMRDCGVPNCRNLGNFGNYLNDLFGLLDAGLIFAAIAELVNDPEGIARDTVDELGGLLGDAVTGVRDLIGA